jgi:serine/threonine protein kinase
MNFSTYHLTAQIRTTALNDTYLAYPLNQPERKVVLKVFHAMCLGPGYEARDFLRDGERLQQLQHPHLVPVLDTGIEQGQPFVVSPFFADGSLSDHLQKLSAKRLSAARTLHIGIQLGWALSYCHTNDVLHGNIKPANVLFENDETVLLSDFGLASLIDVSLSDDPNSSQAESYQAPEQEKGVSCPKSDQFSLACVLYELLTGIHPFTSSGSSSAPSDAQREALLPPSRLIPDLPEAFEAALLKALAHDPSERFETVAELVAALEAIPLLEETTEPALAIRHFPAPQISRFPESDDQPDESARLKAPVFPFAPEASVSYRNLLSSLHIEEPEELEKPHDENEEEEIDAEEVELEEGDDLELGEEEEEPANEKQEQERVRRWEKSQELEELEDESALPLWTYGDEAGAGSPDMIEPQVLDDDAGPVTATTVTVAATAAAPHAQMARFAAIAAPKAIRSSVQHNITHNRRPTIILLTLALLLALLGFSQTYLFGGFVAEANLDPSTLPRGIAGTNKGTPQGQTPVPTAHPTKKPTPQPTKKPTPQPTKAPTSKPTATPIPIPTSPPPTQVVIAPPPPTPTPTPTPSPPTPAEIYAQATSGTPAIDDPLTTENANNWALVAFTGGGSCGFTGGAYQIDMPQAGGVAVCLANGSNFSNFAFQTEMVITAGDGGGLVFRDSGNTMYRFRVDASGYYDLVGLSGKTLTGTSSAVHTGTNQLNLLTVVARGGNIYLYINKQLISLVNDSSSGSGSLGFFGVDGGTATTVVFRNAKVWKL